MRRLPNHWDGGWQGWLSPSSHWRERRGGQTCCQTLSETKHRNEIRETVPERSYLARLVHAKDVKTGAKCQFVETVAAYKGAFTAVSLSCNVKLKFNATDSTSPSPHIV